ncbi:uncharacterized protein EI90DRAFT_1758333 [Cantharellus anzutake]|uniref:uncharacterized protein n=1 Tax=Cantharellus anzutake TaxID=1750568 RepID=UPI001903830D|nr:uncharacterized protein EI90DRAFT_1758333 [Cantharellus anzutake]KAF8341595.1 hypothetical protein EI90DRAFT_1758333 [Cantharellus anzutake]
MRFWNAVIPLALLPIVAADFHLTLVACAEPELPPDATALLHWEILPANQDSHICHTTRPNTYFPKRGVPIGSKIYSSPCGGNITISDRLDEWFSDDGKNGTCWPVMYDGGIGQMTSCPIEKSHWCMVFDVRFCSSDYWCKGRNGGG